MNHRIVVVVVVVMVFVSVAAIAAETKKGDAIGYIEAIRGAVFFKEDANAPETPLSQKRDIAQILRAGNRLRCGSGGWLRVMIGGELKEIRSASWTVLSSWSDPVPRHVRAALADYGRTGGRARGDDAVLGPVLQWPADDVGVLPTTFVIRWSTAAATCPLKLVLQTMGREVIWSGGADAKREVVDAADVRKGLSKHRGSRMSLTMSGPCAGEQNVTFEVLSGEEEAQLNEELRGWTSYADQVIFARIGRASVFAAHRLYAEAAGEYETALREAPESRDLLARTISAHARAGDTRRMKELQDRLR
jgi:hypothetical protein